MICFGVKGPYESVNLVPPGDLLSLSKGRGALESLNLLFELTAHFTAPRFAAVKRSCLSLCQLRERRNNMEEATLYFPTLRYSPAPT